MVCIVMGEAMLAARPAGRPRSAGLDAAIAAATLELLEERGYAGLTFTAVADRAGTTTPALYRRYSSKADLVVTTVFRTDGDDVVADTGDLRADLASMVRWALAKYADPAGRAALAGLLAEPRDDGVRLEPLSGVWHRIGERLQRAVDDGEVGRDVDVGSLVVMFAGPAMMATLLHGNAATSETWVERITSMLLDGIGARGPGR